MSELSPRSARVSDPAAESRSARVSDPAVELSPRSARVSDPAVELSESSSVTTIGAALLNRPLFLTRFDPTPQSQLDQSGKGQFRGGDIGIAMRVRPH
jgi:hypothetical protein